MKRVNHKFKVKFQRTCSATLWAWPRLQHWIPSSIRWEVGWSLVTLLVFSIILEWHGLCSIVIQTKAGHLQLAVPSTYVHVVVMGGGFFFFSQVSQGQSCSFSIPLKQQSCQIQEPPFGVKGVSGNYEGNRLGFNVRLLTHHRRPLREGGKFFFFLVKLKAKCTQYKDCIVMRNTRSSVA
jgi:hypothetical protein